MRADRDGCAPEDFYSTTNHQTSVRHRRAVGAGRASAHGRRARHRGRARHLPQAARRSAGGDAVVCGIHGIKIVPEFQARDRLGFAFMTNEISSERRVEVGVARIADDDADGKAGRRTHRLRRRPGRRAHRRRRLLLRSHPRRLRRRAARRQRARRARRRAGAVRHVARRRHGERTRDRGRPPPSHARDQRDLPRRRPARGGRERRADVGRDVRVHPRGTWTTCSPAAFATTARCRTR